MVEWQLVVMSTPARRAANKRWLKRNPIKANEYHRNYWRNTRLKIIEAYGGKCQCCGEARFEFLCVDHKQGGGAQDRKRRTTRQILQQIIRDGFPADYRILCANCNQALGCFGKCPHEGF